MSDSGFFKTSRIKIEDISSLLEAVEIFKKTQPKGAVYLRGQCDFQWPLLPTIGRPDHKHAGLSIKRFSLKQEKQLLHRFRRYAHAYLGRTVDEWEALFIARHHGLPVRLLDWTSNPLVGLYNAANKEPKTDGAIWAVLRRPNSHYDFLAKDRGPFDVKGVRMIYPIYITPRLNVQSGFFTIHGDPYKPFEKYQLNDPNVDFLHLTKWRVPKSTKDELLDSLSRVSINEQTLFPDLDGLARGLWQTEVIRTGKAI